MNYDQRRTAAVDKMADWLKGEPPQVIYAGDIYDVKKVKFNPFLLVLETTKGLIDVDPGFVDIVHQSEPVESAEK